MNIHSLENCLSILISLQILIIIHYTFVNTNSKYKEDDFTDSLCRC